MDSYVVDYKRMKRIEIDNGDDKINLNHIGIFIFALLFMYIFKRIKDRKSYQQP
jgi:hypothetical protein